MPKCKVCGAADVSRWPSGVDYLWLYRCDTCGHIWYKSKHKAPGIHVGSLINLGGVKGMSVYTLPERERYCPNCHSLYHFMKGVEIPLTCSKCGGILIQKIVQEPDEVKDDAR